MREEEESGGAARVVVREEQRYVLGFHLIGEGGAKGFLILNSNGMLYFPYDM